MLSWILCSSVKWPASAVPHTPLQQVAAKSIRLPGCCQQASLHTHCLIPQHHKCIDDIGSFQQIHVHMCTPKCTLTFVMRHTSIQTCGVTLVPLYSGGGQQIQCGMVVILKSWHKVYLHTWHKVYLRSCSALSSRMTAMYGTNKSSYWLHSA